MDKTQIAKLNTLKEELSALTAEIDKNEDGSFKIEFNNEKFVEKFQAIENKKNEYEATKSLFGVSDISNEKFIASNPDKEQEEDKNSFKSDLEDWAQGDGRLSTKLPYKYEMQLTGPYDAASGPHGINEHPAYLDKYVGTVQGIIKAWQAGSAPIPVSWVSAIYRQEIADSEVNAAAIVAEKSSAQVSSFATEDVTITLQNVPHLVKLTMQQRQGVGEADRIIRFRGRQMLDTKIDDLFLNNNTSGYRGLNFVTGATTTAIGTATKIDAILNAILTSMVYEVMPTHTVLNQVIWGAISQQKDDISRYLLGDPATGGAKSCWGLPFVVDSKQPTTKMIVTDLNDNITKFIWDKDVRIRETDSATADDFEKDIHTVAMNIMVTAHAYRPEAHQIITL